MSRVDMVALLISLLIFLPQMASATDFFRFNLPSEPETLSPARTSTSLSSYLLGALYTPLMQYQQQQLRPRGAQDCARVNPKLYRCTLRKDWLWSDNVPVVASQFASNWQKMQEQASPRLNAFRGLQDVTAIGTHEIHFKLKYPDSEFLYRLVDPAMGPYRDDIDLGTGRVTTGNYFVQSRVAGRSFTLKPNLYTFEKNNQRPDIEALIVESENTALALFETHKLNFITRLTAENTPLYKGQPGFIQLPVHRMDYIGFNSEIAKNKDLSERLIYAIEPLFKPFVKLFSALGPPGCMSVLSESKTPVCYKPRKIKPFTDEEVRTLPKLKLMFATQGGADILRVVEYYHAGWKKNLNLDIELAPTELGVMTQALKKNPPPLFRRGVQLERPTCLAALEIFESTSPDNYIGLNDKSYDAIINELRTNTRIDGQKLCQKGLQRLLDMHRIIPQGQIHFTMLSDNKFDGILLNELNQMDLSGLKPKASP